MQSSGIRRNGPAAGIAASWRSVAFVLVVAVLGTLQKVPCLRGGVDTDRLATWQCYSDIPHFYIWRGLAADVGWLGGLPDGFGELEYPPLINVFIEAAAKATHLVMGVPSEALIRRKLMSSAELSAQPGIAQEELAFLVVNAVGLLLAALVAVIAANSYGWRIDRPWTWLMAAPLLVATFVMNWDVLAIAFSVLAVIAWDGRRWGWFGAMVALGAATKLFPLVLIAAGFTLLVSDRRWRPAVQATGVFVATWVVVNLPLFLSDRDSWTTFWVSNSDRSAYFGSLWMALRMLGTPTTPQQLSVILAAGVLFAWLTLTCAVALDRIAPTLLELGTILLLVFFAVGKVFSPQYSLWVVLAVIATVSARWLVGAVILTETFHYVATWLFIRGITTPEVGVDKTYLASVALRLVAEGLVVVYLLAVAARRSTSRTRTSQRPTSPSTLGA